jgi:tRNA (cytidine/uridine-2'-O-)-methyltransferase
MGFHIMLYQPEIPQNTGNIARTCAATNTSLHIIRPMGFRVDDKYLKRAGLDYWDKVNVQYYDSIEECMQQHATHRFFFVETNGRKRYSEVEYQAGDFFVFGRETKGIPNAILKQHEETWIRIPMNTEHVRSLNVSNTAAILIYEALRQTSFPHMS